MRNWLVNHISVNQELKQLLETIVRNQESVTGTRSKNGNHLHKLGTRNWNREPGTGLETKVNQESEP